MAQTRIRSVRICFVGDSLVAGVGDPEYLGWAGRLCAAAQRAGHDVTYYNLGIRRNTSADILVRWQEEVARRLPPDLDGRVVFSFGVNDTAVEHGRQRVELEASLRNARAMLRAARRRYPVLMVGPPPTAVAEHNPRTARLSRQLGLVCRGLDVPYLDVFDALLEAQTWTREAAAFDGSHPRAGGYSELAALVEAWPAWQAWFGAAD